MAVFPLRRTASSGEFMFFQWRSRSLPRPDGRFRDDFASNGPIVTHSSAVLGAAPGGPRDLQNVESARCTAKNSHLSGFLKQSTVGNRLSKSYDFGRIDGDQHISRLGFSQCRSTHPD